MKRYGGESALTQQSRDEIERELRESLAWNPNPEASDKVIVLQRAADIRAKDRWPEYLQWMVQSTVKMRRVFAPPVRTLQVEMSSPASTTPDAAGA